MTASEQISTGLDSLNRDSRNHEKMGLEDAQTLMRVLCHKKDKQASRFLKRQYQLPTSSGDFSSIYLLAWNFDTVWDIVTMMYDFK